MEDRFVNECKESETSNHLLKKLQDRVIDIITLGGWLFTGKLVEVEDEQVVLCDVTVTSSGGLTLCSFEVYRVTICLDTITSIGKPHLILW